MEAVQIIGGRAGQVFPHIIPLMGEQYAKGKHVIFLVPQQYTLQAERELVERLRLPGMIDLEVLSPQRLYRQVHEKAGSDHLQPLDDRGQQMAISQVLTQVRDQLTFYAHVVEQPGLPSRIAALMNDMKKAGMVPADLADHAKMVSSHATQAKEGDLAIIWQAYEELIEGRFADAVSQQQDVNARLLDSGVMQGACVYVYGFDVLPQPFMALLVTASRVCEQMVVTFTMDKSTPQHPVYDERIFATQRASAEELKEQFDAAGIPVKTTYISDRKSVV